MVVRSIDIRSSVCLLQKHSYLHSQKLRYFTNRSDEGTAVEQVVKGVEGNGNFYKTKDLY